MLPALWLLVAWVRIGTAACPLTREIAPGDTLPGLAEFYFGDSQYWPAILLGTNSRGTEGFGYVPDLYDLRNVSKVCIPKLDEAQRERSLYERYLEAVRGIRFTDLLEVDSQLVEFSSDRELHVATWIRERQLTAYGDAEGHWNAYAPEEIWVTVEPHLREFCSAYAAAHGGDLEELTLRLEQRLGLPPGSNKTMFLEIRLPHPDLKVIFRPCLHPETNAANCPAGPPGDDVPEAHRNWFYQQYYSAYGISLPRSFPWTALGYTFDWARAPGGTGTFQRVGESEFVIRKGAPIEILRAIPTAQYCAPQ